MYRPSQSFIFRLGAAGWREKYMNFLAWSTLMTPPPPAPTASLHFRASYPIDVSHLSFNFLCLLLVLGYMYLCG